MYPRIEIDFKARSRYKKDTTFIVITYIGYTILALVLISALDNSIYSYLASILILIAVYLYTFWNLKKIDNKSIVKFWNFRQTIRSYVNARNEADLKLLISICKENSIDTRPKILEALRHYQLLVPRNIIGSGVFLSLAAIIISMFAFVYDESSGVSSERLQFMFSAVLIIALLYWSYKAASKQILSIYGSVAFFKSMEDMLSTIYFKSLIK